MIERKKLIGIIVTSLVFFVMGNIFAYLVLFRNEVTSSRSGFRNPTGAPHIEGPVGPPPVSPLLEP